MKKLFLLLAFALLFVCSLNAQESSSNDWKFSGASQIRAELDGKDFCNKTYPLTYTSMRTRLALGKSLWDKVDFFVQIQDSRVLGEAANTLKNMKNIDLHQGYVQLNNLFAVPLSVQAGRFEMSYGTNHLFSANLWNYQGRSFDGLRFILKTEPMLLNVFSITHTASSACLSPAPSSYKYPAENDKGQSIYGFYASFPNFFEGNTIDFTAFYDQNSKRTDSVHKDLKRFTAGLTYYFDFNDFSAIAEFDYQFGKYKSLDVAAYLAFLSLQYKFDYLTVSANLDMLSGTEPAETEKFNSFETSYGAKHRYKGFMDYFGNAFLTANNLGLGNYYLSFLFKMKENPISFQLDGHYFLTNKKNINDLNDLGQEIDFMIKYAFAKGTTIEWGASAFLQGDLMKELWNKDLSKDDFTRKDIAFWSYLMLRLNL